MRKYNHALNQTIELLNEYGVSTGCSKISINRDQLVKGVKISLVDTVQNVKVDTKFQMLSELVDFNQAIKSLIKLLNRWFKRDFELIDGKAPYLAFLLEKDRVYYQHESIDFIILMHPDKSELSFNDYNKDVPDVVQMVVENTQKEMTEFPMIYRNHDGLPEGFLEDIKTNIPDNIKPWEICTVSKEDTEKVIPVYKVLTKIIVKVSDKDPSVIFDIDGELTEFKIDSDHFSQSIIESKKLINEWLLKKYGSEGEYAKYTVEVTDRLDKPFNIHSVGNAIFDFAEIKGMWNGGIFTGGPHTENEGATIINLATEVENDALKFHQELNDGGKEKITYVALVGDDQEDIDDFLNSLVKNPL